MTLTIDDVIRHRLSKFYAVSLVHPITFEMMAEAHAKSATDKEKHIILHYENEQDAQVELRDTSKIGFEWSFAWEGERYRWFEASYFYRFRFTLLNPSFFIAGFAKVE
ncbi:hypothetical protein RO3G_08079 [Rhizopus delemar RA 99-880]|uniref:Uncharacterized protein n=1 Tax=Rhizopus delemar (strain RA 99-880 / ATCC MYA-4621 / FGSC 9543 / NRRL 43880) TaxID=246409 RepID=I1C4J4_RHIO9|nr:hypothetical protein RO3G_08079 [Rhizopus delemar RA 99-880]|eukprot:EIE83374.1 hypothetical protein RO3G_08079 [Rhizopus delemar RA 99-880]